VGAPDMPLLDCPARVCMAAEVHPEVHAVSRMMHFPPRVTRICPQSPAWSYPGTDGDTAPRSLSPTSSARHPQRGNSGRVEYGKDGPHPLTPWVS
jgi:hypothetical protein